MSKQSEFFSPFGSDPEEEESSLRPAFPENEEELPQNENESQRNREQSIQELLSQADQHLQQQNEYVQLQDLEDIDIDLSQQNWQKHQKKYHQKSLNEEILNQAFNRVIMEGGCGGQKLEAKRYDGCQEDQEWLRKLDKTIAAKAFVFRGYGVNHLKEQLKQGQYGGFTIDQSRYKSVSGSMARQTYRRLQSFLLRDCNRKLQSLTGYEMKLLQTLLLNCRSTLSQSSSNSFVKIVKITYSLDDTDISEEEAVKLYDNIYHALQKKIKLLKGPNSAFDQSESDDSLKKRKTIPKSLTYYYPKSSKVQTQVPCKSLEREIVKEYLSQHSLSKIRDNLRARRLIGDTNTKPIRNVLRRVLRAVIRKIQNNLIQAKDYNRSFNRMTDEHIKWLLQAAEGLQVRKLLCRAYLMQQQDKKFYQYIYRQLKHVVDRRQGRKNTKKEYNLDDSIQLMF